ncbi:hypothetical protein KSP39_PZI004678 [Platanthera zijinensis]|uniref:Mitochondrial protein n=1 Tax=Platanthera zijinensis TaxID=2320716 RepID=A0AAP0BWE7_9ASPA
MEKALDYADSLDDCRTTNGYCLYFGGPLVTWRSKKQTVLEGSLRMLSIVRWPFSFMNSLGWRQIPQETHKVAGWTDTLKNLGPDVQIGDQRWNRRRENEGGGCPRR